MKTKGNCSVRILSRTDGKQSVFTANGNIAFTPSGAKLCYRQDNCVIEIETDGKTVRMQREGDVYLRLFFHSEKITEGTIGVSPEQSGGVEVYTKKAEVLFLRESDTVKGIKIILEYVLSFSAQERQEVSINLIAEKK